MTTKEKFIQLALIHSTKHEAQTVLGLTSEGRVFKGVFGLSVADLEADLVTERGIPNLADVDWYEMDLPDFETPGAHQ